MKKEKLKLKVNDKVICYDGYTMMHLSTVKSVDIEKGTATLDNGIVCKRESKENLFKRADYMAKTYKGFIKLLNEDSRPIYDAWIFKQSFSRQMEEITLKIKQRLNITQPEMLKLAFGEDQELFEYIQQIKRSLERLKKLI